MTVTELADNLIQLFIVTCCGVYSAVSALKKRSMERLLTALFYLSFGMGLIYWILYIILFDSTPRIFCVSELSWTASYIFLAMRLAAGMSDEERKFRTKKAWILPIFSLGMCIFFCQRGSYFENILMGSVIAVCGFLASKILVFGKLHNRENGRWICKAVILFFAAEYVLWISSYFWISDNFLNPYFLADTFVLNPAIVCIAAAQHREEKICRTV